MSNKVGWTLFCLLFFFTFTLFQFESDSRKQRARLADRVNELELRLSTYIKTAENDSTKRELSQVNLSQQQQFDRVAEDKRKIMELLEMLINKDEKFARDLQQFKQDLAATKVKAGVAADE